MGGTYEDRLDGHDIRDMTLLPLTIREMDGSLSYDIDRYERARSLGRLYNRLIETKYSMNDERTIRCSMNERERERERERD